MNRDEGVFAVKALSGFAVVLGIVIVGKIFWGW